MDEKVYIISDIEMGRGDITDDFCDDDAVVDFINSLDTSETSQKTTLVLNGDVFDFLKMAYKDQYPRYITEEISLWKLNEVIQKHAKIFDALKKFLVNPGNLVFFVIGNHDADLVWPSLQQRIRQKLGTEKNVLFDFWYRRGGLHAEHGHLLEPFFSVNPKRPLVSYKDNTILNTAIGTQICFSHLVHLKRKFPKDEQYFPKPLAFSQNPAFNKEKRRLALKVFWNDLIVGPIRYWNDPTRRVPWLKFLDHFLHFGFDVINDEKIQQRAIKKIVRQNPQVQCFVLGHFHILGEHEYRGKKILVTDTWRNEYDLTQNMQKKKKSFVEILYRNGQLQNAELKTFDISH